MSAILREERGLNIFEQSIHSLLVNMLEAGLFSNMFAVINVFCLELPIFLREHFNGMYRTDTYFICRQLAELPIFLFLPLVFETFVRARRRQ